LKNNFITMAPDPFHLTLSTNITSALKFYFSNFLGKF
jgi:hypothetical protein